MSKNNPAVGDIVRINDTSVGNKHGKKGTLVRIPVQGRPLEGDNRFRVDLETGERYVTRFATDLVFLDGTEGGGSDTIPAPKAAAPKAKVAEILGNTLDDNKANAILAARVEAGKTVMLQVKDRIKPLLPAAVAEHADHPAFSLFLANIIAFSQKQFLPGNTKAAVVADCVMKATMLDTGASFDLPNKINEALNGALEGLDFGKLGLPAATKPATPEN